jgi:hypothetical protein
MQTDVLDQLLEQVSTIDLLAPESSEELQQLVSLLWACEHLKSRNKRNLVLEALPQDIQKAMNRDNDNDYTDIELILRTCLDYPDGLKRLIESVASREGESKPFQRVYDFLRSLDILYKGSQIRKLTSLIADMQLKNTELANLYRACAPSSPDDYWQYPRRLDDPAQAIAWVLDHLNNAPVPQQGLGLPPLLTFVERLAACTKDKGQQAQLRTWIDQEAVPVWQVDMQAITALRKQLAEDTSPPAQSAELFSPSLMIQLEPLDDRNPDKFTVKAWLYRSKEDSENLHSPQNNEFFTSESISTLLEELLEVEAKLQTSVTIEFFLPRELFLQNVDQWETAETGEMIGVRNPVVIRSSERLKVRYYERNKRFWTDKWRMIQSLGAGLEPIYLISEPAYYDGKDLYNRFMQNNALVCLCLLLVPPSISLLDKKEVFFNMLLVGIPVALWPRDLPDDQEKVKEIKEELVLLFKNHKLSELPDLMRVKRAEAGIYAREYRLGHCFALLWDDPTRVPLEYMLKFQETSIRS